MSRINTAELSPGITLGEDIVLPNGRLLIREGTLLDFEHLRAVRLWGVQEVEIRDSRRSTQDFCSPPTPGSETLIGEELELLQKKFSKCDLDHPVFQEFYRVACSNEGISGFSRPKQFFFPNTESWHHFDQKKERPAGKSKHFEEDFRALFEPEHELVSLPDIFYQVVGIINNPRSSASQVAEVIGKDPSLSAKLLRIVNSAFYGFPKQVDTISRAVAIIGSDQLCALTLGTSVFALFQDIPMDLLNMRWFWEHSLSCGITARVMASYKNLPNLEQLFISGLLHDLGKLIIFKNRPEQTKAVLNQAFHYNLFHFEAEQDLLGFDHAQLGLALANKWRLPLGLEQAIGNHHTPLQFPPSVDAAVVFMADNLVNALGYGTSGEYFVSPDVLEVWNFLRLPTGILEKLVPLINRQVEETYHLFFH